MQAFLVFGKASGGDGNYSCSRLVMPTMVLKGMYGSGFGQEFDSPHLHQNITPDFWCFIYVLLLAFAGKRAFLLW